VLLNLISLTILLSLLCHCESSHCVHTTLLFFFLSPSLRVCEMLDTLVRAVTNQSCHAKSHQSAHQVI
jgi:hypothetical protein